MQANPTIVEDNCFIGAHAALAEGVIIEENSVVAMGVRIGRSTKIYDAATRQVSYGRVPAGSVVVPGTLPSADVASMKGRSRTFFVRTDTAAAGELLSIAFHDNCDLFVAVATFAPGNAAVEAAIIAFLSSDRILRWVKWVTL